MKLLSIFIIILYCPYLLLSQERADLVKKINADSEKVREYYNRVIAFDVSKYVSDAQMTLIDVECFNCSEIEFQLVNQVKQRLNRQMNEGFDLAIKLNLKDTSFLDFIHLENLQNIENEKMTSGTIAIDAICEELENRIVISYLDKRQIIKKHLEYVLSFKKASDLCDNLSKIDKKLNKYNGSLGFNYTSNEIISDPNSLNNRNQYNIGISTSLNKDIHPGELNFTGTFQFNLDGKRINEQISDVFMSYDINVDKNHLKSRKDMFGFFQRTSNSFLNIGQRYMTGVGYVHDFISSNSMLKEGGKNDKKIERLYNGLESIYDTLQNCSDFLCRDINLVDEITSQNKTTLEEYKGEVQALNKKKYRKHRFGFLVGGLYEYEQSTPSDSIRVYDFDKMDSLLATIENPIKFDPVQKARIELRLHYVAQFNEYISFSLKPYWIIPANITKWEKKVRGRNGKVSKVQDHRYFIDSKIAFKKENVSFKLGIQYNFDKLPANATYEYDGIKRGYFVPNEHLLFNGKFTYTFV